jgi:hypothetical protein
LSGHNQVTDTHKRLQMLGFASLIAGIAAATWAWLLMFDATSRSRKWQLDLFAAGIVILGWGAALLVPDRWRGAATLLMLIQTPLVVLIDLALRAALPA